MCVCQVFTHKRTHWRSNDVGMATHGKSGKIFAQPSWRRFFERIRLVTTLARDYCLLYLNPWSLLRLHHVPSLAPSSTSIFRMRYQYLLFSLYRFVSRFVPRVFPSFFRINYEDAATLLDRVSRKPRRFVVWPKKGIRASPRPRERLTY